MNKDLIEFYEKERIRIQKEIVELLNKTKEINNAFYNDIILCFCLLILILIFVCVFFRSVISDIDLLQKDKEQLAFCQEIYNSDHVLLEQCKDYFIFYKDLKEVE